MFKQTNIFSHHLKLHYPLNLSILLKGGKENNNDSLSSGERTGKSSNFKSGRPEGLFEL